MNLDLGPVNIGDSWHCDLCWAAVDRTFQFHNVRLCKQCYDIETERFKIRLLEEMADGKL